MKTKIGLGWLTLTSILLSSCWAPLPPVSLSRLELVNVWDAETSSPYEELNLAYSLFSSVPLSKITLTTELTPDVEIRLRPLIHQTPDRNFEGSEEGIRFSYFEPRLPRGRYKLTLTGTAGQEQSFEFYLDQTGLLEADWNKLVERKSGELILSPQIEWEEFTRDKRTFYKGEMNGNKLLVKGLQKQ